MSVFKDKVLLITGGTGSFGNAVLRRFLNSDIKEIRILAEMRRNRMICVTIANPKVKFYIGNVRDKLSVDIAMGGVDYVFRLLHSSRYRRVNFPFGGNKDECHRNGKRSMFSH